ncbi:hypothetical protein D3C81_2240910 [compost metagenome]
MAQELLEVAFSDKANAGAVLLFGSGQSGFLSNAAHLRLGQMPDGEHGLAQLILV